MVTRFSPCLLALAFILPISSASASVATSEDFASQSSSSTSALLGLVGGSGSSSDLLTAPDGLASSVTPPAGASALVSSMPTDFDLDGNVSQPDYQIWKSNYNAATIHYGMPGDANGDGLINSIDYVMLRDTLGASSGAGEEEGEPMHAPEPAHAGLIMFSLIALGSLFRRNRA